MTNKTINPTAIHNIIIILIIKKQPLYEDLYFSFSVNFIYLNSNDWISYLLI